MTAAMGGWGTATALCVVIHIEHQMVVVYWQEEKLDVLLACMRRSITRLVTGNGVEQAHAVI